jgi:hypothetical protein
LVEFGIHTDQVKRAIGEIVKQPPPSDPGPYIWGFKESLDLLALDLDEEQLPSYDTRKSRATFISETPSSQTTAVNTPDDSVDVTPEASPGYVI